MSAADTGDTRVLVVGAGPTGLAATLFLAEHGLRARLIEQHDGLSRHSKAFGVNPRTLELLEPTGVTARLLDQGRRVRKANLWRPGRRVARVDLARVEHRFPFMLIHSQARSEQALADALAARGVGVELGARLVDLAVDGARAHATLERADGTPEQVVAAHVLGADGARSTVRARLGVEFPADAYAETWGIVDLELHTPLAADEVHLVLHDGGVLFLLRLEADTWRVAGNLLPLLEHLPAGTRAGSVAWQSDFTIRHGVAARLAVGPVCLAGDAAHLHSPLGARGLNLGVEDAYVWARLLARGRLDAWEALRRPVMEGVVRRVARLTELARGRSPAARLVRVAAPLLGLLVPFVAGRMRRTLLGLDHALDVDAR